MAEKPKQDEPKDAPSEDTSGLRCHGCGCRDFRVLYTRPAHNSIMRVRKCRNCGRRKVTFEEG